MTPQNGIIQGSAPAQVPQESPMPEEMPQEQNQVVNEDVDPAALEAFLDNSAEVVTRTEPQIAKSIKSGGLAYAASVVFDRVDSDFGAISDLTKFFGGIGTLNQIIKVAEKNGVNNLTEKDKLEAISTILARQIEKGIKSGKYNPQEMLDAANKAKEQMAQQGVQQQPPQSPQATQEVPNA